MNTALIKVFFYQFQVVASLKLNMCGDSDIQCVSCLLLDFNASGTQDAYLITSLQIKKSLFFSVCGMQDCTAGERWVGRKVIKSG